MSGKIALLGDSIFDNSAYTGGEPDVVTHLRAMLPTGWQTSLLAVDGSVTTDLQVQLRRVQDESHIVISLGGNDALMNSDLLNVPVSSTAEALAMFGKRVDQFERSYRSAIHAALTLDRDTTLCTIYNGNLGEIQARLARIGLMMFNDVILRIAFERHLSVVDLRLVCTDPLDYANQIEPSGRGGRKIAAAIARALGLTQGGSACAHVYAA
ncbi:MAG: SGNH/GDSL hydrolase family protein [Bradyrhizobiaceae bacterium]|nr:SGNH/GDSL hydrolase family protein [Bradyrhizobiaceae bacterium]